ncbi:transporter [Candidatus Moduliflexus flocculans]|uniref:Autoinducer 2 import system permease protein LsrD n=1 Tax=Candidatus Moduliflexus flocculans TaxID=1499966 RepID=A0A0S6VRD9_9BACT|nr:transporter [Candidatus Moduliflexus flocculans]
MIGSEKKGFTFSSLFMQWEFFLLLLFIGFNVVMSMTTRNYLNVYNLFDMTFTFVEKAIVALIMTFIIITGNIDISVASMMALSSVSMASLFASGANVWVATLFGVGVGTLCGFLNGLIITKIELLSMIITLATFSFYRGIAYVILGDQAVTGFPKAFGYLGGGYIGDTPVPFSFVVFLALALIMGLILHKTRFGRMIYAIGWNEQTCYASGVPVKKIKIILFTVSGFLSGVAAMFLTSRIGNTRPNLATGFELEIITIVILGGVSIAGGIGRMWGVLLSIFLIGTIRYGLGLHNIPGQIMLIIAGSLLILSILINNAIKRVLETRSLRAEAGE